jgi:hypothetical protein
VPNDYTLYIAKSITIKNNNACEIPKPSLNNNSNKIKQKRIFWKKDLDAALVKLKTIRTTCIILEIVNIF